MYNNKFNFMTFFITTFLFIILPIILIFFGCVYYNTLKIKTDDIKINIKNQLQNKTISEKLNELETAKNIFLTI